MNAERLLALMLVGSIAACAPAGGGGATSDGGLDATTPADAPVDRPPEVVLDSGCPAPARLTPEMLPSTGFLPPVRVRLDRVVDGDTAHFIFPILGSVIVRFLWVNTEESHAAVASENTAFGIATAAAMAQILPTVQEFYIVRQENPSRRGQPVLDMYGRTLGLVFADGDLFQTRLVRDGWSAYYTDFGCAPDPLNTVLLDAEAEARANHRGIWAPGHPTDYSQVFTRWISNHCRPNPFRNQPYCMP